MRKSSVKKKRTKKLQKILDKAKGATLVEVDLDNWKPDKSLIGKLTRLRYVIASFPSDVKWAVTNYFQRATRGWADSDAWNLYSWHAKVTREMLAKIRRDGISYATTKNAQGKYESNKKRWDLYLRKMEKAFAYAEKIGVGDLEIYYLRHFNTKRGIAFRKKMKKKCNCVYMTKEQDKEMKEGFKLFYEHYFSLWD
ncbi:hypothetical protein IID24_03025 [Patescibacteria group bacterium]|nr:hypothetical protein [Patescibacteria group bacterium]